MQFRRTSLSFFESHVVRKQRRMQKGDLSAWGSGSWEPAAALSCFLSESFQVNLSGGGVCILLLCLYTVTSKHGGMARSGCRVVECLMC